VRVIGPINSQSGLGQATRMTIDALHAVGIKPQLLDFYLDNPAPRAAFWTNDVNIDGQVAINIIHLNAESIPLAAAYLPSKLFKAARNIGYFFWELPQPARCHELAIQQLDEIWVSSEFNRETYASASNTPVLKMGIAVEPLPDTTGVDLQAVRRMHGIPSEATAFLFTFDSFSFIKRKNPGAALRAFRRAFPDDENAVLIVKTHNLTKVLGEANVGPLLDELRRHADEDPRIVIIDETLSYRDLISLKSACDAYVSLHRSEGWGFGAVEAMQLGKPVIATAFSGNLEFCNEETSFLVPYTPRYLEPDDYIFVRPGDFWAEPDIATAAKAMRAVYDDPGAGRVVGARARDFVQDHFSPGAVGRRYLARFQEIASGNFSSTTVQSS
jgi:glycosyltransferase involved in cell wall biosynthesis